MEARPTEHCGLQNLENITVVFFEVCHYKTRLWSDVPEIRSEKFAVRAAVKSNPLIHNFLGRNTRKPLKNKPSELTLRVEFNVPYGNCRIAGRMISSVLAQHSGLAEFLQQMRRMR